MDKIDNFLKEIKWASPPTTMPISGKITEFKCSTPISDEIILDNKNISLKTAGELRRAGIAIPSHIEDGLYLTLHTYLDIYGHIKVDVTIPQYALNVVDFELFETVKC